MNILGYTATIISCNSFVNFNLMQVLLKYYFSLSGILLVIYNIATTGDFRVKMDEDTPGNRCISIMFMC